MAQVAWNYMNDGLRTSAFCRFKTDVIACACLHLGSLKLQIPVPDWWEAFKVSTEDLEACCTTILALYARPKRYGNKHMIQQVLATQTGALEHFVQDALAQSLMLSFNHFAYFSALHTTPHTV